MGLASSLPKHKPRAVFSRSSAQWGISPSSFDGGALDCKRYEPQYQSYSMPGDTTVFEYIVDRACGRKSFEESDSFVGVSFRWSTEKKDSLRHHLVSWRTHPLNKIVVVLLPGMSPLRTHKVPANQHTLRVIITSEASP